MTTNPSDPRTGRPTVGARAWRWIAVATLAFIGGPLILGAQPPTTGLPPMAPATLVYGTAYDSIARRPIPGLTLEFVNATDVATSRVISSVTDSSGRYTIDALAPGKYIAGFFHASLDSLGFSGIHRTVQVEGGRQRIDFGTPSPRTLMRTVCQTAEYSDSAGLLLGHIRRTEDQQPARGAVASVEWSELTIDASGLSQRNRRATAQAAEPGWFAICGVPTGTSLHARAVSGTDSSGYVEVEVPAGGLQHVTFYVGGSTVVSLPERDSAGAPVPGQSTSAVRGRAKLTGTVVDHTGRPLQNAHALVWGTALDVTTNDRGVFVLDSLPGGTHTLEVRVIGYIPVRRLVQLAESRPATVDVVVDKSAQILSTVTVRGELLYSRGLMEFERRRRSGFGRFVTSAEIERQPNARLSELVQMLPGVFVTYQGSRRVVQMRESSGRGYCTPTLYVDGRRDMSGEFDLYRGDELGGIEVYSRQTMVPAEFMEMGGCGVIAVWTRQRPPRLKKD